MVEYVEEKNGSEETPKKTGILLTDKSQEIEVLITFIRYQNPPDQDSTDDYKFDIPKIRF